MPAPTRRPLRMKDPKVRALRKNGGDMHGLDQTCGTQAVQSDVFRLLAGLVCSAIPVTVTLSAPAAVSAETITPRPIQAAPSYPNKPIRFIDGFPAGGGTDYLARIIAQKLADRFGHSVVVDNRPGAGANIGAEIAAKATPDGYTLFMGSISTLATSHILYPRLQYNVMRDFTFVTSVASGTYVFVAHPSVPAKSVKELIALAKEKPGQLNYGSGGIGTAAHLVSEMLKSTTGVEMVHVPYKGAAPAVAAVAAGEVQLGFPSLAGALPLINAGRLRALAVTSGKRAKAIPELPTIAESGFPDFDNTPRYGVLAPAAMHASIVRLLNAEINNILQRADVQAMFSTQGMEPTGSTSQQLREFMHAEIERWAKVIKAANIKAE